MRTIEQMMEFVAENGRQAFRGMSDIDLQQLLFDTANYKSFYEEDSRGITWFVVANIEKRTKTFFVYGIVIRKDKRNELMLQLLNLFHRFYKGYTIEGVRGKTIFSRRQWTPEQILALTHKYIQHERIQSFAV
jgi:hypothetical protein